MLADGWGALRGLVKVAAVMTLAPGRAGPMARYPEGVDGEGDVVVVGLAGGTLGFELREREARASLWLASYLGCAGGRGVRLHFRCCPPAIHSSTEPTIERRNVLVHRRQRPSGPVAGRSNPGTQHARHSTWRSRPNMICRRGAAMNSSRDIPLDGARRHLRAQGLHMPACTATASQSRTAHSSKPKIGCSGEGANTCAPGS